MVLSPITHQPAELVKTIPTALIIEEYKKDSDFDVSEYFTGMKEISVYKCKQTGYRFYYPFTISGNDKFYEYLQKYDWYYADWKWDYDAALPFIDNNSKVLDIGCGYGNFLMRIKDTKGCDCTGLEFNDKAMETGKSKGLHLVKAFIQDYAETHENEYDAVCFFQVLEHIADIDSFVTAAIKCVKPGGRLIICVPNNNPHFYKYAEHLSFNMPPHHMGLWDEAAFRCFPNIYPLVIEDIVPQKLNRFRFYTNLYINNKASNSPLKKTMMSLVKPFITGLFVINKNNISVGSILAVYKKK